MKLLVEVKFYDEVVDELLKFAVIIAKSKGKWVFCKHKERDTYEIPGGHREEQETIETTAKRELCEETGATQYSLIPICVYSETGKNRVNATGEETFGMLYLRILYRLMTSYTVRWRKCLCLMNCQQNGHIH